MFGLIGHVSQLLRPLDLVPLHRVTAALQLLFKELHLLRQLPLLGHQVLVLLLRRLSEKT
jgi:hypothetical protein